MKRTLAIILTVIMLLSALPLCASAASADLLEYEINDGEVTITGYDSYSYYSYGELIIPSEIEGYPVTSIGDSAFWESDFYYISIPDGVTSIGWGAFSFSDIEELYIPASVTNIEFTITRGCLNLYSVVVDKNNPVYDSRENCNAIVETASNTIMLGCYSTTFPASITTIGNSAYSFGNTLDEITIPGSIKKIEDYAFEFSNSLKKVIVEEGTVSIDPLAFWECCDITTMYLPTSIIKGGFACDADLYDIYYAGTKEQFVKIEDMDVGLGQPTIHCSADGSILKVLNDSSFHEQAQSVICYELDENTGTVIISGFGETNSYVEDTYYSNRPYDTNRNNSPFHNNETINEVVIEEGVTSICKGLFDRCTNLKTITIPGYISIIDEYAFNNCQSLSDVYFGGTEEQWNKIKIDKSNDCLSNATIHFSPYNYEKCGRNVFWELNEETGVLTISGTGKMYDYKSDTSPFYNNDLIKEVKIEDGVRSIGDNAFSGCSSLTSITIPEIVTSIGDYAFNGCSSLLSVKIPDNFTSISEGTFGGCSSLTSITIPDSVISIGEEAFSGCSSLTSVIIPDSVTHISKRTFSGCSNLTFITIPDSVRWIDRYAFENCSSLTSITIPDNLYSIGYHAFENCESLTSITIPDSVTSIEDGAFLYCSNVKEIYVDENNKKYDSRDNCNAIIETKTNTLVKGCQNTIIPYGVSKIADYAFSGCHNLTSITIPDSVSYIGRSAFGGCGITFLTIPDSVNIIEGYAFSCCRNLTSVTISNGLTDFGGFIFQWCEALTSVTILDGVTCIDHYDFYNCSSLTSVTIPDSVTTIKRSAFDRCKSLSDVYFGGTREQWNKIKIDSDGNNYLLNATIHCIDDHVHTLSHIVTPASCVVKGMEYDICTECGEVLNSVTTPEKGHSWGEWVTVTEPTVDAEGLSQRECTECHETETQPIPKLNVAKDEKSGVEIIYSDEFEKGIEVTVSDVFDGQSLQLINANYATCETAIFDISTYKDGEMVQPDGKVTVRIPLPEGFGTQNIFVCYVDSVNGNVTSIPTTVEDGYVIFTAEHFSHYAVVEIVDKAVNSVKINDIELKYKEGTTIKPEITADDGVKYEVKFESSNPKVATVDKDGKITTTGKGETKITCTVTDQYGNVAKDTCKVTVKFSFGQWLIWILLFGFLWY